VKFTGCNLTYAEFHRADVSKCNFTGATLFRTRLHNIIEENAVFSPTRALSLATEEDLAEAENWKPRY
jgi:uncharacterized protein YjbI with pentapeptide repeats